MREVLILGGGLAGLSTAAALGSQGFAVRLFESRGFLGGRATSYPLNPADPDSEVIDNCQHVLLRCCANLLDFYRRLNVTESVRFHDRFFFLEPGGRVSELAAGWLPAPLHFSGPFLRMACFDFSDKRSIARAILAIRAEGDRRQNLDQISMLEWLMEKRQTPRAIERFWRPVLVSAINEELDRMAACHGFQVFRLGFLASRDAYHMGVPSVPLGELYSAAAWRQWPNVEIKLRSPIEEIGHDATSVTGVRCAGRIDKGDFYVSALPLDRLAAIAPGLAPDSSWLEHSPITGIHLWFDRPVTDLPHATLLDRTIQWMFNKDRGRYIQLVVSASRSLLPLGRADILDLAVKEFSEFFPAARQAQLIKGHVVKEVRATFSAKPGIESLRPEPVTRWNNFFLAGDWTCSGWPATMEGAVRSGYRAAEAVCRAAGSSVGLLLSAGR
ncbi:MAG: hydroxysqualene dehydroxylase HpnE [Bryobacteraceae bacterium]